jgi:hypothetical protein
MCVLVNFCFAENPSTWSCMTPVFQWWGCYIDLHLPWSRPVDADLMAKESAPPVVLGHHWRVTNVDQSRRGCWPSPMRLLFPIFFDSTTTKEKVKPCRHHPCMPTRVVLEALSDGGVAGLELRWWQRLGFLVHRLGHPRKTWGHMLCPKKYKRHAILWKSRFNEPFNILWYIDRISKTLCTITEITKMKKRKQNHEQGSTHCFSWSICFFLAIRKTIWQVVWRILLCMQFGTASTILCAWVQQNQIQTHKSAGYKIFPTNKSVDIKSNPDPPHNGRKTHQIASCRYPLLSLILTTQMHHCPSSFFFPKKCSLISSTDQSAYGNVLGDREKQDEQFFLLDWVQIWHEY